MKKITKLVNWINKKKLKNVIYFYIKCNNLKYKDIGRLSHT